MATDALQLIQVAILFVSVSGALGSASADAQSQRTTTREPEDKTGKVYAGLSELIAIRDEVGQKFVLFANGEYHQLAPNRPPVFRGIYSIGIVDKSRKFEYMGRARIVPLGVDNNPIEIQTWTETIRCDGELRIKTGFINADRGFKSRPKGLTEGRFLKREHVMQCYFEPLEDILHTGSAIASDEPTVGVVEKIFLGGAKFLSSAEVLGGNVESKWNWVTGDVDFEITLVQGATCDFLPIEVRYKNLKKGPWQDYFSQTRIHWNRVKEVWLPDQIEAAYAAFGGGVVTNQFFFKLQWLVGDDAGDQFFQCGAEDYRVPLMEPFNIQFPFVVDGVLIEAPPWESPEGLFMDPQKKDMRGR